MDDVSVPCDKLTSFHSVSHGFTLQGGLKNEALLWHHQTLQSEEFYA